MTISVTWGTKIINIPKADTTLIQSNPTEIRELDINLLRLTLKDLEDDVEGMPFPDTHRHNTEVLLAGITYARVFEIINGYTVTFEDGQYAVNLFGANHNVGDVTNVNQVSIRVNNSAGLISSPAIEFAAYKDGIVVDVTKTTVGTAFDIGTGANPVGNIPDALQISTNVGVPKLKIIGDVTFTSGHNISNFIVEGESPMKSNIIIDAGAVVDGVEFANATISGTLDSTANIEKCSVGTLSFFEGMIIDSEIQNVTITLGGTADAHFVNCHSGVPGASKPTIDAGGSGRGIVIINYAGGLKITNKTGSEPIAAEFISGELELSSTVTNGNIVVRGIARVKDFSTGSTTLNVDGLISAIEFDRIFDSVESLRPHHTSTSQAVTVYWDPFNGDDTFDGRSHHQAVKTWSVVDSLITDSNHDIIQMVPGNPSGPTIITEKIVMSKRYTFLRGPGRDIKFVPSTGTGNVIEITAEGVEVSGILIQPNGGAVPDRGIYVNGGNFALIEDVFIQGGNFGIGFELLNSGHSTTNNLHIHGATGDGMLLGDNVNHVIIKNGMIAENGGHGINLNGSAVHDALIEKNQIYDNVGDAINIGTGADTTFIFNNFITPNNSIVDNGTNTLIDVSGIADAVWDEPIADHTSGGSTGEALDNVSAGASPATIAGAVWDKILSDHNTAGTMGENQNLISTTYDLFKTTLDIKVQDLEETSVHQDRTDVDSIMIFPSSLNMGDQAGTINHEPFLRFQNITIPPNSIILSSTITFYNLSSSSSTTVNLQIFLENTTNPILIVDDSDYHTRNLTSGTLWSDVESWPTINDPYLTSDFSSELQTVVNRSDWISGSTVQVFIKDNGSSTEARRVARTFNADAAFADLVPKITIQYIPISIAEDIANAVWDANNKEHLLIESTGLTHDKILDFGVPINLEIPIVTENDDSGARTSSISFTGGIIIGNSSGGPRAGLWRFQNVQIPQGAIIDSAILHFIPQGSDSATDVNLNIYLENVDDSSQFIDFSDYSTRIPANQTTSFTPWDNVPAWDINNKQTTVNFALTLKEVIDRSGWVSGNAIHIIIQDDGSTTNAKRRILSHGERQGATLFVTFRDSNAIADAVWDETLSDHTSVGSTGEALDDASAVTSPATIADAVWDEVVDASTHNDTGSAGEKLRVGQEDATKDRKISTNKAIIVENGDGTRTITVYDDDGITPIHVHTVQADLLDRTPVP